MPEWAVVLALVLVALVLGGFVILARRHPVLLRMGARNALRRRSQTLIVVAGLMVGTAIISGSLASGDSLRHGIREGAYDALGPADVFVQLDGQLHFPRVLYEDFARNTSVVNAAAAMTPLLYEEAAVTNEAAKQSEPRVSFIGFDPTANRPFGLFHTVDGRTVDGRELGDHEVYLVEGLAAKLAVGAGDSIRVNYAAPPVPRVPRITMHEGSVTASAGACVDPRVCQFVLPPTDETTYTVEVAPGAVALTTVVAWLGPNAERTDLDQVVRSPSGATYANANGSVAAPDNPSILNVTTGARLEPGQWTLQVGAKAAVNQPFRAITLVFYEEYNLTALQEFAQQAEEAGFDPADFGAAATAGGGEAPGQSATLVVREVVTKEGFGDFLLGENMFARDETVARLYGVEGKINLLAVSGDLDPERGAARIPQLLDILPRAVNASAAAHPDEPSLGSVKVYGVKDAFLSAADRAGTLFTEFLGTIGSFTVIAGIMLIINIFVMLAEERKSELGMARAVGLSRRQLVYLFGFEGFLYALVASLIGVLLGVILAWLLILGFNDILADADRDMGLLTIGFHVTGASLVYAFVSGFLITLATVLVASLRVSRLNIVRAIRRIDEPPRRATGRAFAFGSLLALLGAAGTVYGFTTGHFPSKVLAPNLLLFGLGLMASRWWPRRIAFPAAGAAVAAWCLWSIFQLGNPSGLLNRMMGPVRGVLIILAIVLILIHLPQVVTVTRSILLRFRSLIPAVRPGVAYPLEKKTRTGLTVTMFSLVILVVVAFSIFGATFTPDPRSQSGGYDVDGDTTVPIGDLRAWYAQNGDRSLPDPFAEVTRFDELRYAIVFGGTTLRIEGQEPAYQGPPVDYIYTYGPEFAQANGFDFESLDPAYGNPREAYEAVLRDPSLVIVSLAYNFDDEGTPGRFQVGDTLSLTTAGGTAEFRIIGFQKQLYLGGIFVHPQVLEGNFQRIRGEYLFQLEPGADPAATAQRLEAAFSEAGMNAVSIAEESERQMEQSRRFLTLFQLFLGFGLIVGIASLGIVTARNVLERRQEIGMLRAVGYSRRDILKMFYIEIFLTTTLGVLVGGLIGIFTSYGVVASTPSLAALGVRFTIPWGDLALILLLVYVAVFLATFLPARRGARTPPAEAVRYVE